MKKWQCSVCGYIHEGTEPPENCPVCGADKSKFVELVEEAPSEQAEETPSPEVGGSKPEVVQESQEAASQGLSDVVMNLMVKQHAHPISVHIPNGLLPVSVLFVFIAILFGCNTLGQAAFYNLLVVALAMPFVIFSGYVDWQKRFGGNLTRFFVIKMICAGVVTVTATITVIWAYVDPGIVTGSSNNRFIFILLCLIMLVAAATAGFFGGKLVFKE